MWDSNLVMYTPIHSRAHTGIFQSHSATKQLLNCILPFTTNTRPWAMPITWDSPELMYSYCSALQCYCTVLHSVLVLNGAAQISCRTVHSSCSRAALHVLQMGHSVPSQSSTSHIRHHSVRSMPRKWCLFVFFFFLSFQNSSDYLISTIGSDYQRPYGVYKSI